jgi:hypothetical protein
LGARRGEKFPFWWIDACRKEIDLSAVVFECHALVFECHALVFECHALVFEGHALVFDCHAVAFDCYALVFDCHAVAFDCHALVFDCHAVAFDCYVVAFDCHAVAFDCHAVAFDCNVVAFDAPPWQSICPANERTGRIACPPPGSVGGDEAGGLRLLAVLRPNPTQRRRDAAAAAGGTPAVRNHAVSRDQRVLVRTGVDANERAWSRYYSSPESSAVPSAGDASSLSSMKP